MDAKINKKELKVHMSKTEKLNLEKKKIFLLMKILRKFVTWLFFLLFWFSFCCFLKYLWKNFKNGKIMLEVNLWKWKLWDSFGDLIMWFFIYLWAGKVMSGILNIFPMIFIFIKGFRENQKDFPWKN